jgi:hypothetical protein
VLDIISAAFTLGDHPTSTHCEVLSVPEGFPSSRNRRTRDAAITTLGFCKMSKTVRHISASYQRKAYGVYVTQRGNYVLTNCSTFEDSVLLGYDPTSVGNRVATFRKNIVRSSSHIIARGRAALVGEMNTYITWLPYHLPARVLRFSLTVNRWSWSQRRSLVSQRKVLNHPAIKSQDSHTVKLVPCHPLFRREFALEFVESCLDNIC